MKGILMLSHGTLCQGVYNAMEMLGVDMNGVKAVPLFTDSNIDDYTKEIDKTIDEMDSGEGVLVLVDLVGGTPFNILCTLLNKNVEAVTGLNFAMGITAVDMRDDMTLESLAEACAKEAKDGILNLRTHLRDKFGIETK